MVQFFKVLAVVSVSILLVSGCEAPQSAGSISSASSAGSAGSGSGSFGNRRSERDRAERPQRAIEPEEVDPNRETIWDLLNSDDERDAFNVNKFLWNASLDVLSFLPLDKVDPYSGLIETGYGRAPGSSQSFKVTVIINSAALDARSLRVQITNRNGSAASQEAKRGIEDAILTRARQLRIERAKL